MEDSRTDKAPREIIALAVHEGMKSLHPEAACPIGCQPRLDGGQKMRRTAPSATSPGYRKAGVDCLPDRAALSLAAVSGCGRGINGPAL